VIEYQDRILVGFDRSSNRGADGFWRRSGDQMRELWRADSQRDLGPMGRVDCSHVTDRALWSTRTLARLFDLCEQPRGCISDLDEMLGNISLGKEVSRLSLGCSQPCPKVLRDFHEVCFNGGDPGIAGSRAWVGGSELWLVLSVALIWHVILQRKGRPEEKKRPDEF
jgi:hypothetical protein